LLLFLSPFEVSFYVVGVYAISFSTGAKSADDVPLLVKRGDLVGSKLTQVRDAIPVIL
jgi:hypothetical protein